MVILNENLTDKIVKEIGKFTILWANFEKEYCNYNCSPIKIKIFAEEHTVVENILKKFSTTLKGRVESFGNNIYEYVNYNLIPENAHNVNDSDKILIEKFIKFEGSNLICGAFLAIYRIRNNLLHGLKIISELNGQIELFKVMNKVLENIRRS